MSPPYSSDDSAVQRILEARARDLARTPAVTVEHAGEEHVFFQLGSGGYAVPARLAREISPLEGYTAFPGTPPFLLGLVNVRGRLIPLIDLRPLLHLEQTAPHSSSYLILIAARGIEAALLADTVHEIKPVDHRLAAALAAARDIPWVRGIDRQMNLVLDPVLLLDDPRLIIESSEG